MNKTGLASALIGLFILIAAWYFAFYQGGAVPFAQSIIGLVIGGMFVGGLVWLGIFLLAVGLLILII